MNQKLVTKKNRKVRRLRELYPDINIKILYQRDYLHLVAKYGLDDETGEPVRAPVRFPGPPRVVRLSDRARRRLGGFPSSDAGNAPGSILARGVVESAAVPSHPPSGADRERRRWRPTRA